MKRIAMVLPLFLMGCVTTPMVSDFNGSSVKVVEDFGSGTPSNETGAEAARICGKVGKKSEFASYRSLPNYQTEYRYLCL